MTREEILNMPDKVSLDTFFEIDKMVPEIVMGWHAKWTEKDNGQACTCWHNKDGDVVNFEPCTWFSPSVNLQDAWQVFKITKVIDWIWQMDPIEGGKLRITGAAEDSYSGATIIEGDPAITICRAALLAVWDKE